MVADNPMSPAGHSDVPRSWLYVPGDRPDMLDKALSRGADALIVDLEDAVPAAAKDVARAAVADWLCGQDPGGATQIWVRVNPGALGHDDARAVVAPALRGLCLAKCAAVGDVRAVDGVLADAERETGLPRGHVSLSPILEDAAAVLAAAEIARAPRVVQLQLGEADLCAQLGLEPDEKGSELVGVRTQVVLASAAAGIRPPVGPVCTDYRDEDALRRSSEALRRMGYRSRACIHPRQIAPVHEVFTLSSARIEAASRLVRRFDEALASGQGVLVDDDGTMVDEAVVRRARALLASRGAS